VRKQSSCKAAIRGGAGWTDDGRGCAAAGWDWAVANRGEDGSLPTGPGAMSDGADW
jgi:hypothetical protein